MDMKTYLKESKRTAAGGELNRKDYDKDSKILGELSQLDAFASMADCLKRNLFYKDDLMARATKHRQRSQGIFDAITAQEETIKLTASDEMLHAVLGLASEVAEMAENIVRAAIEGRDIDPDNMKEEFGDALWYIALGLRDLDTDFETEGARNIAKLKARFPDKFDADKAINRDLEEEKKALAG